MNNIFMDYVLGAIALAVVAWLCVYISRPFFMHRWAKVSSQIVAVFLLITAFGLSKGLSEDQSATDADAGVLFAFAAAYLVMKSIAIYLIACYAKSVNKSPYWSFVGLLNFMLTLPLLIFGLWKSEKKAKSTRDEMIGGLRRMVGDSETSQEKRDWATDRLRTIETIKP